MNVCLRLCVCVCVRASLYALYVTIIAASPEQPHLIFLSPPLACVLSSLVLVFADY